MRTYTDDEIEEIARHWRATLGVDSQLHLDMLGVLEAAAKAGLISGVSWVGDDHLANAEGSFDPDDGVIYLPLSANAEAAKRAPRANFTMAHELSHSILGVSGPRNRDSSAVRKVVKKIARDERLANRLASAFLAPYHRSDYSPASTAAQIATRFNLSARMAVLRLEELGRIYRRRNRIDRELPPNVVDFLVEKQNRGFVVRSLPAPVDKRAKAVEPVRAVAHAAAGVTCTTCGQLGLTDVGSTKAACATCRNTADRFQDGDRL